MRKKVTQKELNDNIVRALGTYIACQHFKIDAPAFPLGYAGFTISILSGRNAEVVEACQKFLEEAMPLLEKAENQNG